MWPAFAQEKAVILGKVSGGESDTVMVAIQTNSLDPKEEQFRAILNQDGQFRLDIPLTKGTIAELVFEDDATSIFLAPGEPLTLSFRARKMLSSIKFKGNKMGENLYLTKFEKKFVEDEAYQVLPDIIFYKEAEFTQFLDERKENMLGFFEQYNAKYQFSAEFKEYALAEIEYGWANDKLTYADLREHIVNGEPRLTLTPTYYGFLAKVELNDPAALASPTYTTFLKNYFQYQATLGHRQKTDRDYFKANYEAAKKVLQGDVRSHVLGQILYESFRFGHIRLSEEMLADYRKLNNKKEYLHYLEEVYAANRKFALGSPAPDFALTTAQGNPVRLSDFKGKWVYLSFWTTTCGPCLVDMPYAQKLADKLDGKPIVFISVGLDENQQAWQTAVTKKTLSGIHLYGPGMKSEVAQNYNLGDLPAYFLIDADGTFLSVKPKRPSNNELAKELLQAIEQKPGLGLAPPAKQTE
jgi:thiol-disulfide isomerase/thioredoxin